MFFRTSFSKFIRNLYWINKGDVKCRWRLQWGLVAYYVFGSVCLLRTCICISGRGNRMLCGNEVLQSYARLYLQESTLLVLAFYPVIQCLFILEHSIRRLTPSIIGSHFENVFHITNRILPEYSFKQALVCDSSKIQWARNVPFQNRALKENLWIILLLLETGSRFIYRFILVCLMVVTGTYLYFIALYVSDISLLGYVIAFLDYAILAFLVINQYMAGEITISLIVLFERIFCFNLRLLAGKLNREQNPYRKRFFVHLNQTIVLYLHSFKKMTILDKGLVRWYYTIFLGTLVFFNMAALSSVLQDGITLMSSFRAGFLSFITMIAVICFSELFLNISRSLSLSRKSLMKYLASGRHRTNHLQELIRYWNFLEIIHSKKGWCFYVFYTRLNRKSTFMFLVFTFSTGVMFISQEINV